MFKEFLGVIDRDSGTLAIQDGDHTVLSLNMEELLVLYNREGGIMVEFTGSEIEASAPQAIDNKVIELLDAEYGANYGITVLYAFHAVSKVLEAKVEELEQEHFSPPTTTPATIN